MGEWRLDRIVQRSVSGLMALMVALSSAGQIHAQGNTVQPRAVDISRDKKNAVQVQLSAESMGGGVVQLSAVFLPLTDAPAATLDWMVPLSATLSGGSAKETLGAVIANSAITRTRSVSLPGPGVYKLVASAGTDVGVGTHFGAAGVLFATVDADGGIGISDKDPNAINPNHTQMQTSSATTMGTPIGARSVAATNGDPCFTVRGRLTRIERVPRAGPRYDPDVQVPVRYARVEVREEDTFFDDSYGEMQTDANGNYSFSFCDDDGIFDDELEIYIRLHAQIRSGGSDVVSVEDDGIIDDVYEFNSAVRTSGGGDITINAQLTEFQSAVMNIADAIYEAWAMWNLSGGAKGDDATFDGEAEVHYEPGENETGSYYNGYFLVGSNVFNNDDITIADDPSNPDPWDDSVIMHEWGHMADDYYGCDDNGGGPHSVDTLTRDLELSWGEGYPDYYQSAVRANYGHADPSVYIDVNGAGTGGISVDLETYDQTRVVNMNRPDLLSDFNELAIAAMLWDLNDSNNDARTATGPWDRVSYGHRNLQEVYTDPAFESNGDFFDDTCTSYVYLYAWRNMGKTADKATAEAVTKNLGRANPFNNGSLAAAVEAQRNAAAERAAQAKQQAQADWNPNDVDTRWWQQLTMVVDNSASMGTDGKLDAVKTVMHEQVNDVVAPSVKGVEVRLNTFNNTNSQIAPLTRGQFFPEGINPIIDQITPLGGIDPGCQVNALDALAQSVKDQHGGQAWVYTDGDPYSSPPSQITRQVLNQRQVRGSVVLLGGCGTLARKNSDVTGDEERFLQLAADGSQPGGIVPYLITALGTGGQFLFVSKDQLSNAKEILRAQLANSAGAGKWSDYVSDSYTYRWDKLTSSEYQWFPAESLGQAVSQIPATGYVTTSLSLPFSFYGASYDVAAINQDGVLEFNPCGSPCPIVQFTRAFLDVLNTDMTWDSNFPPKFNLQANEATEPTAPAGPTAPDAACATFIDDTGYRVKLFRAGLGFEWDILSVQGCDVDGVYRAYQMWLNHQTGEIRYQYDRLRTEASNAEIGLRRRFIFPVPGGSIDKLLVSNKDSAGASSGMGYKFTPAPPAPTRTYTVAVDALIQSVGFLMTGYSGNFESMQVTDPDGNAVNCADTANVQCLTLDNVPGDRMVQFVQVNVNGKAGNWHAVIDAGSNGNATFSFNALAASPIVADSPTKRVLPSAGVQKLKLNLGGAAAGNTLTAWLQTPNGARWGNPFTMFDDGAHEDGRAGDGRFGVLDFTPPGRGVGYLWVSGNVSGTDIVRSDPVPFNFQPLIVNIVEDNVPNNNDAPVTLTVDFINLDPSNAICGFPDVTVPDTWGYNWDLDLLGCVNIPANGSRTGLLTISPAWFHAPSLSTNEIVVSFTDSDEGAISASDSSTFIRMRDASSLVFDDVPQSSYLRPGSGDAISLTLRVLDEEGAPVRDETAVELTTSNGTLSVGSGAGLAPQVPALTQNGKVQAKLTAGNVEGEAVVTATLTTLTQTLVATVTVQVRNPKANQIDLQATPNDLSNIANTSALLVTVRDPWGNAVPNATVWLGAEGDGQLGLIDGAEVVTGTTNAQGQILATFTKANAVIGSVGVRAELLMSKTDGGPLEVVQEDRAVLTLGKQLYLPMMVK